MMVRRRLLVPLTAALLAPSLALVPSSSRPSTSRFRAVHPSRPRHTLRHSLSLPPLRAIKDNDDIIDADFQSVSAKEGGADKKAAPVEATPVKVTPVEVVGSNEVSSGGGGAAGAAADAKEEEPAWRSIFPKGPEKEPEPPMPTDPALRAIAQDFGMRRTIASNWIWLSVILDMKAKKGGPGVVAASQGVRFWLWTMFSLAAVWEQLCKSAKQDDLQRPPNKLLNLGLLLSGTQLLCATSASVPLIIGSSVAVPKPGGGRVPLGILVACLLPSFNQARKFGWVQGVSDWARGSDNNDKGADNKPKASLGLLRQGGSVLSVAYGVLAVEAVLSALSKAPSSLPFLRAAVLYVLHITAADNKRREIGSERFRRLNDALFYSSFGMFGGGGATDVASGAKWLVTNAVPLAYLFMATQAKNLSTTTAKELEESASSTA